MAFGDFIRRDGGRLLYGPDEHGGLAGRTFRFMGVNYAKFICSQTRKDDGPSLNDAFEVNDLMDALEQLGATALRFYTVNYRKPDDGDDAIRFFDGPGKPNEAVLDWFEHFLEKCAGIGVRVIVSLTCQYGFFGGIPEQVAWRYPEKYFRVTGIDNWAEWGQDIQNTVDPLFYEDRGIRDDFKACIEVLLHRFRDNKAILCWETGNELRHTTTEWTADTAAFIKERDPNHMIMDGYWCEDDTKNHYGMQASSLGIPQVDIVRTHFYPWVMPQERWNDIVDKDIVDVDGRKVYVVSEFGFGEGAHMSDFMRHVLHSEAAGALLWDFVPHKRTGGFFPGAYSSQGVCEWRGYRYPGFKTGSTFWEAEVLDQLRACAFAIRGLPIPPRPVPKAPIMLPIKDPTVINWRGSAGAEAYDVYRAVSADGPWEKIGADVCDSFDEKTPGQTSCFSDTAPLAGASCYRVVAKNKSGASEPSNTIERDERK